MSHNEPYQVIFTLLLETWANIVYCVVWALRVWKIHMLEIATSTKVEGEDIRNPDTAGAETRASPTGHKAFSMAFALKACFSLTKV